LKALQFITLLVFAGLMTMATLELPPRGDVTAPVHQTVNKAGDPVAGAYFIQNAYRDAATPNMVTVILADYRSWDTLGEVVVVFAGGMACYFILRRRES